MHLVTKGRATVAALPDLRLLMSVAVVGTVGLTVQILVAHRLGGRDTSALIALGWATATIGAWALAGAASLAPAKLVIERISPRVLRSMVLLMVAVACVLLAAALRTAIDPLLPSVVQQDAATAELFRRYVIRWSGPGMLVALAIVALPWITSRRSTPSASDVVSPAAAVSPSLDTLVVRIGERSVPVAMADVRWIAASGNYAQLHGAHGRQFARITMTELEQRLDPARFLRVHRSAIVALDAIREVRRSGAAHEIVLTDGNVLAISRVGRKALEARIGHRS